jgi:prolyl-tRNA synthetase
MRQSKLFTKTDKSAKEFESVNATLLQKGAFIKQVMAGVYEFLPLGLRVLAKIENIVREEMDKIGNEVLMPSIAPKELWEQTGRLEKVDVLFKASGANKASVEKNNAEYVLNSTHEEVVTPLAKSFNQSYKDFPFAIYQIQTKFRNEARAKSGLLRGREFRMKDLYSFHVSEEDLKRYYEEAKKAYTTVFERVGLGDDTVIALASGGDFTKDFSHEFQTRCETGEDIIFYSKKLDIYFNREVAPSKAPSLNDENEEIKAREDVVGKGIIGVQELADYLKIPVEKTTKTLIFETDKGEIIAAAVRGGYDVDEGKLLKIIGAKSLKLASAETVKKITGAEVGYAGILNLPAEVKVYIDESVANRKNFECGANKTDYHSININFGRDLPEPEKVYDFKVAKEGDMHPETGEVYEVFRAAEVGNIFPLNTKFSEAFDYKYTDENGKEQIVYMGCYGIGTTRIMGVIVEKLNDEKGILWPEQIAPFKVHLISVRTDDEAFEKAEKLYNELTEKGIEVLWDDRAGVSAGEKFADADLIGTPWRVVVSAKTGEQVEIKKRSESESKLISKEELYTALGY